MAVHVNSWTEAGPWSRDTRGELFGIGVVMLTLVEHRAHMRGAR